MFKFDTEIVKLPGKMNWPVIYIPAEFSESASTKGRVNATATVEGVVFQVTLLPSKNGHYVVYNQAMRKHCGKTLGDTVHVALEIDDKPREVEIPADITLALNAHGNAMERFQALPYYTRREEINKITNAKTAPTREKRIAALLALLS